MKKQIDYNATISDAEWSEAITKLRAVETIFNTFTVSLTDEEKMGMRSVAEGREGYVREVLRVAMEFQNSLPRSIDVNLLSKRLTLFDQWKQVQIQVIRLLESVEDTTTRLGADIMTDVDAIYGILTVMRKSDANLDKSVSILEDYNKKFGKSSKDETPPTA